MLFVTELLKTTSSLEKKQARLINEHPKTPWGNAICTGPIITVINVTMNFDSSAVHKWVYSGSYKEDAHLTGTCKMQNRVSSPLCNLLPCDQARGCVMILPQDYPLPFKNRTAEDLVRHCSDSLSGYE